MTKRKTILVVGATGKTGILLVEQLLNQVALFVQSYVSQVDYPLIF